MYFGSLLGPELSADFLPGDHVLWTIAVLLAPPSECSSMRFWNGQSARFGGDRVPNFLDQFETLGDREFADLFEEGRCHGDESAVGRDLRQVELDCSPFIPAGLLPRMP